jgi:hypothetical protein
VAASDMSCSTTISQHINNLATAINMLYGGDRRIGSGISDPRTVNIRDTLVLCTCSHITSRN